MQRATPFTDNLSASLKKYYALFRAAVAVACGLILLAVVAAYVLVERSGGRVLDEAAENLLLKESAFDKRLATWCSSVEKFAGNIASASIVQLSVSYYAGLTDEQRKALGTNREQSADDQELVTYLKDMFADFAASHGISDALIVMADGDILLGSRDNKLYSQSWKSMLERVLQQRTFQYGSLHASEGKVVVDVAVPIFPPVEGTDAKPLGALLMALPLSSQFSDILTPPADNRGIQKIAFVQIHKTETGHIRTSVEKQGSMLFVRDTIMPGTGDITPRELADSQILQEDQHLYYTMDFPSDEKIAGYVCTMVPQIHVQELMTSHRYFILACLGVVIAFILLVLVLLSMLRDKYVRQLVNRRIANQKAILDRINASIQDGMILLSKAGDIVYMNEHFFTADGRARWVRVSLHDALTGDAADKVLECMHHVLENGREGSVELLYGEESAKRLYRVTVYASQEQEGRASDMDLGCVAIFRDITEFRNKARESQQRVQKILNVFSTVVESVDAGLRGHTDKMLTIIDALSPLLHFSKEEMDTLNISARLFQIGKLFVPRHLLNKRGKLTPEEYAQVSKAPEAAYELLYSLNFGLPVAETVYEMGERVDGRGPRGLKGDEILFTARVLSVVNAFCSMVSPRTYRDAMSVETALDQLRKDPGFDREVVEAMSTISVKDFQTILRRCTGEGESYNHALALWDNVERS